MLEKPEAIELVVKHPLEKKKTKKKEKQPTDNLAASSDRIAVVRVWQTVVTPSLVTVKEKLSGGTLSALPAVSPPPSVGTEKSAFAMCVSLQTDSKWDK